MGSVSEHTAIDVALGVDFFRGRTFYARRVLYFLQTLVSGSSVSLSAYLDVGGFSSAGPARRWRARTVRAFARRRRRRDLGEIAVHFTSPTSYRPGGAARFPHSATFARGSWLFDGP